jgi:hypothetical protein
VSKRRSPTAEDGRRPELPIAELEHLDVTPVARKDSGGTSRVAVIVTVKEPGYLPPGVKLRARVDETMFTGELAAEDEERVRADPRVERLEISRRLDPT